MKRNIEKELSLKLTFSPPAVWGEEGALTSGSYSSYFDRRDSIP